MGFIVDTEGSTLVATTMYDLSSSAFCLINVSECGPSIQSAFGVASFVMPLTSAFGGKSFYINPFLSGSNRITFSSQRTFNQLTITLQGCDQTMLQTIDCGAGINNNNTESIFIFSLF